ncbi:Histone-Lysine N-Methyltransferase Setd2 [Manis pentadactyla]|nr:Histone-Lysine N-Methyltransferase Setd2 [Manis pentadactyla]
MVGRSMSQVQTNMVGLVIIGKAMATGIQDQQKERSKFHRDIKRMQCECTPLSKDERAQDEIACGEDYLNRLLMIECSSRCPNGYYCSNRWFQRKQHADVEVILTEKKGWGLRAAKDIPSNTFVLEYCGDVLDRKEFKARVKEYA